MNLCHVYDILLSRKGIERIRNYVDKGKPFERMGRKALEPKLRVQFNWARRMVVSCQKSDLKKLIFQPIFRWKNGFFYCFECALKGYRCFKRRKVEMIEKIVNSKIRIKLLNLFLSHIDDRYYLRELERMMGESLSPLRRQLVKLTDAGVLIVEEEANLKYYRINKNFEGLERLKNLVIGGDVSIKSHENTPNKIDEAVLFSAGSVSRQFRYDLVVLFFVSVFVLTTAMFVVHLNSKNMKIFSSLIMKNSRGLSSGSRVSALGGNGEMTSGKWKITPGDASVFSAVSINKAEKPEKL